jgi:hypothetical protein
VTWQQIDHWFRDHAEFARVVALTEPRYLAPPEPTACPRCGADLVRANSYVDGGDGALWVIESFKQCVAGCPGELAGRPL